MDELVKTVSLHFEYIRHEAATGVMRIFVRSTRSETNCPYCGTKSDKVHSLYYRKFWDLPIQGKKVEIVINNRKFFCIKPECSHKTFAEAFECLPRMGRRSNRLTKAIIDTATNLSSISASKTLKHGTADVGKSTICRLLKKELQNRQGSCQNSLH